MDAITIGMLATIIGTATRLDSHLKRNYPQVHDMVMQTVRFSTGMNFTGDLNGRRYQYYNSRRTRSYMR